MQQAGFVRKKMDTIPHELTDPGHLTFLQNHEIQIGAPPFKQTFEELEARRLVTVILHNFWVWDWPVAITILAWSTLIKGIMKIGFPEHIRKQAQRFKKNQWVSAAILLIMGGWLLWMGFF